MYSMILGMDKNCLIGKWGKLPWSLPVDLEHFKTKTLDKIIVMGRKTFVSIGRALPNRTNVVITTDKSFKADGVLVFHDLVTFENFARKQEKEILIIGGANLIKQLYSKINKLYITHIHDEFEGDCYIDFIDFNELETIEKRTFDKSMFDEKNKYACEFTTYLKK